MTGLESWQAMGKWALILGLFWSRSGPEAGSGELGGGERD
jgi:hypothetical protein